MAFADLEKAFHRVSQKVLRWDLRVVGVPEWLVKEVQAVYVGARSRTRVNVLFIRSLKSKLGCCSSYFWKHSHTNFLYDVKGIQAELGKKVMISGRDLHTMQTSGKYPCAVCRKGVRKNSVFFSGCSFWVHKKCSDIQGILVKDPDFRCRRCLGNAWAIDGRPCVEVQLVDGKLEVVGSFVYLSDCICPDGGCELATIKRCHSTWGKFRELLPLLTCKAISLNTRGQMYNSCIRGTVLYSPKCWSLRQENKKRLERSERKMLLWMCYIKKMQRVITNSLLS